MHDWSQSFLFVGIKVDGGEDPASAINWAVRRLGVIERTIDCEGDA